MYTHTIGIIRGGETHERERSLALGSALLHILEDTDYGTADIFVDEHGTWWKNGMRIDPSQALHTLACIIPAFSAVSPIASRAVRLSEQHGVPYIGATPAIKSIAHHPEERAHSLFKIGITTPRVVSLRTYDAPSAEEVAWKIVRAHSLPLRTISIPMQEHAHTAPALTSIQEIRDALVSMQSGMRDIFVEEEVVGTHVTVYLIDGFREEERYVFPPVSTLTNTPCTWSKEEGKNIERIAKETADALSLEGFVRVDMTLTQKNAVVRDVRTVPDFTTSSPLHRALESVGATKKEVIEHIVRTVVGDM
ncbi:MAG: hypothetical protein H8D63_01785 [Parcubacteria group bacterium]|nr:hypothetical protein [Parcubacteria group bacterium]